MRGAASMTRAAPLESAENRKSCATMGVFQNGRAGTAPRRTPV
jgi:hypothetical protein